MSCTYSGSASASRVMLRIHRRTQGGSIERGAGGSGRRWRAESRPFNLLISSPRAASADLKLDVSQRSSPDEVKKEIQSCYELIQKLGRGAIYLGSSRVKDDHPHYLQAVALARDIARLLDCTTWTGAGPGLMDAAIKGALEAKKPVGGFKIVKESGEWIRSSFHPYLPSGSYLTCRFFSARKHGLVDAATRNKPSDMTAVVAFPGGIGTLDEVFEILALIQLDRIGSELPVPFILMNYDSFYSKLLEFMHECEKWGTIAEGETAPLWKVCSTNEEALEYLVNFYSIPQLQKEF